jgi:hypothetical protein
MLAIIAAIVATIVPHNSATASWFSDAGLTACPAGNGRTMHVFNGYAHLPERGWPCGQRVRFCYRSRCVIGRREDSGPYVAGRLFDLTASLKESLRCPDLCHLRWAKV